MTTKKYDIENLSCAHCASKMEVALCKIDGVGEAKISFPNKLLILTANYSDALIAKVQSTMSGLEKDVVIISRDKAKSEDDKNSGHSHGDINIDKEKRELIIGSVLFAIPIIIKYVLKLDLPVYIYLIMFLIPYIFVARDVISKAINNIKNGEIFDENFLMSIASIGAFFIGEFPEAVAVMLFYRFGEYLEHRAVESSRKAIMESVDLRPETVELYINGTKTTIPAEDAKIGDILEIVPGVRIPLDGVVIEGSSRLDTSPVTGEPVPVGVKVGSSVISGSVNMSGLLRIKVEKTLENSMVTRILDAVENASANKPQIERMISKFAKIYTPIVVAIAVIIAIFPPLFKMGTFSEWIYKALQFLVVSCPCALVLSVPLAYFAGIGAGSRRGLLFKSGASLEALSNVKQIVLDKTGTITKGSFEVEEIHVVDNLEISSESFGISKEEYLLKVTASAEANSNHPIAESIMDKANKMGIELYDTSNAQEMAGMGLMVDSEIGRILCGNHKLMKEYNVQIPEYIIQNGTTISVALDDKFIGYIKVEDAIKDDAKDAILELKNRGLRTTMLTGDNQVTAKLVAESIGLDGYQAGMMPDEKLDAMLELREKYGEVLYIGDGINDAPVLAGADVGAAMGSGQDAAVEAADVVYLNSQMRAIPESIRIGKKTKNIAIQNMMLAFGIKVIVLILAVLGLSSLWMAVFADVGVALICIANSVRLIYNKNI